MLNMQLIYNQIGIPALQNEKSSCRKSWLLWPDALLSLEGVQLGMRLCSCHDIHVNNYYALHMNVDVNREKLIQNPFYKLVLMLY